MPVVLVLILLCAPLMMLTGLGARRRGLEVLPVLVVAGLFFPVTWVVWYVRDEQPYRRATQH